MAGYYGVNNSELYGSNFSTVLADAPPPLDDTFEEDENEFVFPSEGKKSKKFNGETVAPSIKKTHSCDEKFDHQSKPDGSQLPNGEHGNVEEDSDFGDFAGFADFGSAFGQESSGESQDWFAGAENSVNSPQAVKRTNSQPGDVVDDDNGDEFADFASFQDNDNRVNQENIPNGSSDQEKSNTSDVYNCHKNGLGNRINSNDSSYDMDSDDDFGDFECVEKNTGKPGEITPQSESKSMEIQPDLESNSTSQGRTYTENDKNSSQVDESCQRNIAQCNGDIAGESALNHTSKGSLNISGGQENEFETKTDTSNVENVSNAMLKDKKSQSLDNSSLAAQHGDNAPSERPMAVPEREGDQLKINVEVDSRTNAENSESEIKSDKTNITNANLSSASICDRDSEDKTLPENSELTCNDDDFGEFADFSDPPIRQPSIDNDDDKEICNKSTPDSLTMSVPIRGKENEVTAPTGVVSVQDNDDDDDDEFGDFGSFDKNHDQGSERTDVPAMVDSKGECLPIENNDDSVNDDDNFGEFGIANSEEKSLPTEDQDNEDFGDFGALNSGTKDPIYDSNDHFGEFGVSNCEEKTLPTEDEANNDFGDFGTFTSGTKDSNDDDDDFGDFSVSNSKGESLPNKDQDNDFGDFSSSVKDSQQDDDENGDFGGFGTFDSRTKDSSNDDGDDFGNYRTSYSEGKPLPVESQDNDDDFGDFGTFDSTTKDSKKDIDSSDDFGDFGSFESNTKDDQKGDSNSDGFEDFGAFDAQPKDLLENNESNEFGDFGAFESKVNDVPKGEQSNSNVKDFNSITSNDNKIGDFRTADSAQNSQAKKKSQSDEVGASNTTSKNLKNSRGSDDDFGDFSSLPGKEGSFQASPVSHSSVSAQPLPRKTEDLKQKGTRIFIPGNNVIIKQVGDPVSLCFVSEQQHMSDCQCDVLSSQVEKSLQSNLGLWQQLERSDKEGRLLFHWSNSFSQHKKLLSLMIRPERPPPLQGGAILKPMVSSNFAPFGGGLVGSMLMPEPSNKFPQFSPGLSFLEPVKGSQFPVQSTVQDKIVSHQSVHAEIGLPDLSFVLGNGLKRTASKSGEPSIVCTEPDIKDNMSDTTSESSSLDLDFFAPSTTQPSDGKSESRGLYEEELMGLNIFTSSAEPQKLDSPKPQKTSDTKKVWQHGGVTIPLSSQQSKAQLSAAAKSILGELEDLKFMTSSVLMFPLKNE